MEGQGRNLIEEQFVKIMSFQVKLNVNVLLIFQVVNIDLSHIFLYLLPCVYLFG